MPKEEQNTDSTELTEVKGPQVGAQNTSKTLTNKDIADVKVNVPDVKVVGNGDLFQLISKASSQRENWMKSTKVMQIDGLGCVIQVTTQQGGNVAEALTYVPGVKIGVDRNGNKEIVRIN